MRHREVNCGNSSLREKSARHFGKRNSALNSAGNDIERDDLVYSINEPDNYAVEEALQIVARVGGNVTVVTVGGEDDEEILRREMAMGANHGVLISDEAFSGSDGEGIATILKAFVQKGQLRPDPDRGAGRGRRRAGRRNAGGACSTIRLLLWSIPSKSWTARS